MELEALSTLVCELRHGSMQAQSLHWTIAGPTSIQDHQQLNVLYVVYNDAMDVVSERIVGLGGFPPTVVEQTEFVQQYTLYDNSITLMSVYETLVHVTKVCNVIGEMELSGGTANLIQDIADQLEQQVFFFKQRLTIV